MLVTVEDGVATKIQGDPSMPFTDGTLCTKVAHYLERTYAPERLLHPMRRAGAKGKGEFKRIGWDEASEIAAAACPHFTASNRFAPRQRAATIAPMKVSPAPVVSTTAGADIA